MQYKALNMKNRFQKIKRKLFGFLSFSAALFVFQACYGTPQDEYRDVHIQGRVVSDTTGLPAPGIKIAVNGDDQYVVSDSSGYFSIYVPDSMQYDLQISDTDTASDGHFLNRDTVITALPAGEFTIKVEEKL